MTIFREPTATPPSSATSRFTLAQFFLWTFATCVVLSHEAWGMRSLEGFDATERWYFNIHILTWAPIKGAGLAGLLLWAWRRMKGGDPLGSHPGHWFLIILGADTASGFANDWLRAGLGEVEIELIPYWAWKVHRYSFRAFDILLNCAAIAHFRGSRWWQAPFLAMTLTPLSDIVEGEVLWPLLGGPWMADHSFALGTARRLSYTAAVALVIAAMVSDRRRGVRRDFLHFVGAATVIAQGILGWPEWISWWYVFR